YPMLHDLFSHVVCTSKLASEVYLIYHEMSPGLSALHDGRLNSQNIDIDDMKDELHKG
ncbi:hypothetical protein L9F63_000011, partial [Diploptera punctata]